jgi:hypothetical protein
MVCSIPGDKGGVRIKQDATLNRIIPRYNENENEKKPTLFNNTNHSNIRLQHGSAEGSCGIFSILELAA